MASAVSEEYGAVDLILRMGCVESLSLLLSRLFFLVFHSLIGMCLGVDLFEFILPGVNWASCVCRLIFFHPSCGF